MKGPVGDNWTGRVRSFRSKIDVGCNYSSFFAPSLGILLFAINHIYLVSGWKNTPFYRLFVSEGRAS